ncbi:MAG: hypothetical protein Q9166_007449 [cf. Caloplaca sp. 2 TL-2023]
MPPATSPTALKKPLSTLTTLLNSFSSQLSRPVLKSHDDSSPPNAVSLLYDSSSLLRAQITKLSLLLLNKPFTPSAIASILTSIFGECLPGLMAVYELCAPEVYDDMMYKEVRQILKQCVARLSGLVEVIPRTDKALTVLESRREDILQATGQVWDTCDRMIKISDLGISGLALEKVKEWESLVKDAVEEVEGWDPDNEEEDFDISLIEDGDNSEEENKPPVKEEEEEKNINGVTKNGTAHRDIDNLSSMDSLRITDIYDTKAQVLKMFKLIRMLYPALRKRRISTFPPFNRTSTMSSLPSKPQMHRFSDLIEFCEDFPTAVDDLAVELYDRNIVVVRGRLVLMSKRAKTCIEGVKEDLDRGKKGRDGVRKGWSGEEDEFTEWSGKWLARVKEVGGGIDEHGNLE